MSLTVFVINATNVPNAETFGKSDPYVSIEFQGIKNKTDYKKSELNPTWNEKLEFDLKGTAIQPSDKMEINVKDYEKIGRNRLLGKTSLGMKDLVKQKSLKLSLKLVDGSNRDIGCVLNLQLTYTPPAGKSKDDSGGGTQVDYDDSTEEEDEDYDEDVGDGSGPPKKKKKKKKKKSSSMRKSRGPLSTKKQDFQIRIKIVEARQLPGANISPIARVTCYNQTKQTRVQHSDNSPFWNEVFFFNFFMSPAELFDEVITFSVYHAQKIRSDAFIGSFKTDIGMIYDEPQHSLLNKWLLLSDPDDQLAGAKGYMKIMATILGPGDDAPSFKPQTQDDSEDIESNLLRPAGVMLRPATFKLKLYRAEDIPRMDSNFMEGVKSFFGSDEKKELVDPYFVFSFAGKEVKSKIMYNSDHPEWNQELKLGLRFPSMCERIKFQMFDWDRVTEADCVSTAVVNTTQVSRAGENGFLPTFGPCYVNFYGSPREYSDLPDEFEDLNLGKGEGVAYRGRALVELCTVLGELPEVDVDDIGQDDLLRVQKFQRRRKFKLHAAFLNATMISAVDAPVEFEVSIGNYGNKLDENVPPCSSTTQPTNAVFDGCFYSFLPWGEAKPCVVVDCHWEDISFRLETLNFLLYIIDKLDVKIAAVETGLKANLPTPELAQLMIGLLDQLVADCSKPLPSVQDGVHIQNDLDRQLRYYREVELEHIVRSGSKLRETATDMAEALHEVKGFAAQLKNLAIEPQNSMPDVMIWMICGEKRIAYYRCPAHLVLWSPTPEYRGKYCGKLETIKLVYPGNRAEKDNKWEIPAALRLKVWLGLEKHETEWHRMQTEGELAVFAESYENQVSILGNWTNKGPTMTRPKWSDNTGKAELNKDDFVPPAGWRWDSEWYISPELSMLYDKDAGHTQYLEDVYEAQSRIPGGYWGAASVPWSDVKGDAATDRDKIALPDGWDWETDWTVDYNRAVDEEGWEYTVEATIGGYGAVEKNYHMCRRRRWVRSRKLVKDTAALEQEHKIEELLKEAKEGWEYAPMFTMKFHHKERKMDLVRRRRWHRKMVAETQGAPCFFQMKSSKDKDDAKYQAALTAPRMFLTCKKQYKYQLRAYIYQARDILAGDSNGLSDPFARVAFLNQSAVTEQVEKTLSPTWDQTLIFESVEISGDPTDIAREPPEIIVEIFDHDTFGSAEFLGRTQCMPMVKLDPSDSRSAVLNWYPVKKGDVYGGELLAAFELFLISDDALLFKSIPELMNGKDLPFLPSKRGKNYQVPNGIRPVLQRTAIEVMCWGVRNMQKFQLSSVTSPGVEFEVGGQVVQSKVIRNTKKNPNFDDPLLFFDIMLPREELYTPPLNIRVRDNRQFGRKPLVGVCTIKSLEEFRCQPKVPAIEGGPDVDVDMSLGNGGADMGEHIIDMPADEKTPINEALWEEDIDWWSKFYSSIGEFDKAKQYLEKGYDKIQVFTKELEKIGEYNDFSDFCCTFKLNRGKNIEEEECNIVGEFKGSFRIYPLPDDPSLPVPERVFSNLPPSKPEMCIVRVYIIKAIELQPNDPSGLADPFIKLRLGKRKADNRKDYKPNTLNPEFGCMFELKAELPIEKDLKIQIKDYDLIGSDDVIGETCIDLENRYLTKYRAMCGLPITYCISGPCQWRDSRKPKDLLEEFCKNHALSGPDFSGNNMVRVGNRVFNLADFEQIKPSHGHLGGADQRLALHVLNALPPTMGIPLVPEHIEQRPLYNPLQPGIEQGKLQMWVDMFPESLGPPGPPVDISIRKPKKYELRVVIWNTKDVILEEESITGEKMSDIYVKGWINGLEEKLETDVHYRSMDGEGNFNWRFVFPFEYLPAEEVMVVRKKEHFWSLDETEFKMPLSLTIQIWDNDKFSADDFLGTLELNLDNMPAPAKKSAQCDLTMVPELEKKEEEKTKKIKMVSLFESKRLKGYWPCFSDEKGAPELTEGSTEERLIKSKERKIMGKVEMELELVTEEEAVARPSGCGRDEPNEHPHLEPPKRPETSFLWFTSPWKTLKHIIWKQYKWYFIGGIILLLLIAFIILFIYSVPTNAVEAMFGNE